MRFRQSFSVRLSKLLFAAFLLPLAVAACEDKRPGVYQGYIEGEYVYVSAPFGGRINSVKVEKGARVAAGGVLFELDAAQEKAALEEARNRYFAAQNKYTDLTKGARPTEIKAIDAQVVRARASLDLADKELKRAKELFEQGVVGKEYLDKASAAYSTASADLVRLNEQLATAKLGARDEQVSAAQNEVNAAKAAMEAAEWRLSQMTGAAPSAAEVDDVIRHAGEWAQPGAPVVALLPDANRKARFFVPQGRLPQVKRGAEVVISIDGLREPVMGKVSYISPQAEYTPPYIFSKDNRAKLVFMVEASIPPARAGSVHPGQPVEVRLSGE